MHPARPLACFAIFILLLFSTAVQTQPASPPPPDKYKIAIRYDIQAPRDQHVALYKAMIEHLDKVGFEHEPKLRPFPNTDYEDPNKNELQGFISRDRVLSCLANPSVASL